MNLPAFRDYDYGEMVGRYGRQNLALIELIHDGYMHLLASSPLDRNKPARLYRRFSYILLQDFRGLVKLYSSLADAILASCVDASEDTVTGDFLDEMKNTPIFREYLFFFQTGDASVMKFILSFLVFAKKAEVDFSDLQTRAFRSWLEIEEELEKLTFRQSELDVLKTVVDFLLDSEKFDDTLLLPRHGGGQVSETVSDTREKFDHLTLDVKLARCFRPNRFGLDLYDEAASLKRVATPKSSRLMFVPKTYKTYRSVCMEPTAYMYFQQEVMRWMVHAMERSPLGQIVDLKDQTLNQQYAIWGSAHKGLDTIDLSAASDRVHTDLVRAVFPPKILYYLLGTRTESVLLPDGRVHTLKKFAPMGSALCFPTQCTVFSAVTVIGYLLQRHSCTLQDMTSISREDLRQMCRSLFAHWSSDYMDYSPRLISPRVYGDDIICDVRVTENVTYLLEHFGFAVNKEKSFVGGQSVRESCGIYTYNGHDVTPLTFRVRDVGGTLNASAYDSMVSFTNRCGDYGYRSLHSFMVQRTKSAVSRLGAGHAVPFTTDRNAFGIWTKQKHRPTTTRYNEEWQLEEERVSTFEARSKVRITDDAYLFNQWMRSRISGWSESNNFGSPRILPRYMRIVRGWTPVRM